MGCGFHGGKDIYYLDVGVSPPSTLLLRGSPYIDVGEGRHTFYWISSRSFRKVLDGSRPSGIF